MNKWFRFSNCWDFNWWARCAHDFNYRLLCLSQKCIAQLIKMALPKRSFAKWKRAIVRDDSTAARNANIILCTDKLNEMKYNYQIIRWCRQPHPIDRFGRWNRAEHPAWQFRDAQFPNRSAEGSCSCHLSTGNRPAFVSTRNSDGHRASLAALPTPTAALWSCSNWWTTDRESWRPMPISESRTNWLYCSISTAHWSARDRGWKRNCVFVAYHRRQRPGHSASLYYCYWHRPHPSLPPTVLSYCYYWCRSFCQCYTFWSVTRRTSISFRTHTQQNRFQSTQRNETMTRR